MAVSLKSPGPLWQSGFPSYPFPPAQLCLGSMFFCFVLFFVFVCFFCNRLLENRRSSKSSGSSSGPCYHLISVVSIFKCLMCMSRNGCQISSLVVDGRTYPCMMCESCVQSPAPLVGHTGVALKCLWMFHSTWSRQLSSLRRWSFQVAVVLQLTLFLHRMTHNIHVVCHSM